MTRWLFAIVLLVASAGAVSAEPRMGQDPNVYERSAGFWTPDRPAVGGAYRYRLLLIGVGVGAITAYFVVRLIRNTPRRQ